MATSKPMPAIEDGAHFCVVALEIDEQQHDDRGHEDDLGREGVLVEGGLLPTALLGKHVHRSAPERARSAVPYGVDRSRGRSRWGNAEPTIR